jgi:hypothetical protein
LFATTVGGVDPEPSAVAPSRRTRWHSGRDLEICEPGPYTRLVYAENRKVLRLDGRDVGLVSDGESTSGQITKALELKVRWNDLLQRVVELTVAIKNSQKGEK